MRTLTRHQKEWLAVAATALLVFIVLSTVSYGRTGISWNYLTGVLVVICVYALFALGLSLQFGYAGLLNFGHVAFMGIGAYTVAIISMRFEESLSPHLVGASAGGILVSLLAALLAAAIALIPVLLAVETLLKRMPGRTRLLLAMAIAGLVGLAAFLAMFPLNAEQAPNAVVLLGIVAGVIAAALASLLLGLPAVRLREDYLAIVTLGAAEMFRAFTVNEEWLTRGTLGIIGLQRPVSQWALDSDAWGAFADTLNVRPVALANAALGVTLVVLVLLMLELLARSPWGRVVKAIREDDAVAAALGKNVTLYKLQVLMIGAAIAAVAGILYVWHLSNVFPEHFLTVMTFFAFIILVMGGIGNHKGALLGAILLWGIFELAGNLTFLDEYGIQFAGPLQNIFVGVVLIVIMMVRPQGAVGRKEELVLGK